MSQDRHSVLLAIESELCGQAFAALLEQASLDLTCWKAGRPLTAIVPELATVPSLAILDCAFGGARVLEMARELHLCFPNLPWILLTEPDGEPDIVDALRAGMRGHLLKTQSGAEMIDAIRAVLRGGLYFSPAVLNTLIPRLMTNDKDCDSCVTARDRDLLKLIAEGKTFAQAATLLGLASEELLLRRRQLETRLGIRNTAGFVRYAVRHRIVQA